MLSEQYPPLNEIIQDLECIHSLDYEKFYILKNRINNPFDHVEFYSRIMEKEELSEIVLKNGLRLTIIQEIKESNKLGRNLSTIDPMTGLQNKGGLSDKINECLSRENREDYERINKRLVLTFCDLNKFKEVNDIYGHPIGDEVIKYFAEAIKKYTRPIDHKFRFGGDEFVIIFDAVEKNTNLDEMLIRLNLKINDFVAEKIKQYYPGKKINTGISLGASIYKGDAFNKEDWLSHADDAVYHAKENTRWVDEPLKRVNVCVYDPERKELY
ncbi:diguanylate cyclase [Candidatus Woesearchaeota archaeon]|nr:diguanylate cyclase [Candidatus Woesearchaeota archaeon]